MGWKCNYCDSYNEESSPLCYVCGHARITESVEVIEEESEPKVDEIIEEGATDKEALIARLCRLFRRTYYIGLLVSIITIAWMLVSNITRDKMGDVGWKVYELLDHAKSKVNSVFNDNLPNVLNGIGDSTVNSISRNVNDMWYVAGGNSSELFEKISLVSNDYVYSHITGELFENLTSVENRISNRID